MVSKKEMNDILGQKPNFSRRISANVVKLPQNDRNKTCKAPNFGPGLLKVDQNFPYLLLNVNFET
jgi:hypothetical protein